MLNRAHENDNLAEGTTSRLVAPEARRVVLLGEGGRELLSPRGAYLGRYELEGASVPDDVKTPFEFETKSKPSKWSEIAMVSRHWVWHLIRKPSGKFSKYHLSRSVQGTWSVYCQVIEINTAYSQDTTFQYMTFFDCNRDRLIYN